MRIIVPGTTTIQGWPDGDPIPEGWAELPSDVVLIYDDNGALDMVALFEPPYLRPKTEAEKKAEAAVVKTEEIYREQEIRSATLLDFEMPRKGFALIEEFYTDILIPAARNNIDEVSTPITWGLKELRDNRNTLLDGLQVWIDNPEKTAEDILAFDVENWSGWSIARPE